MSAVLCTATRPALKKSSIVHLDARETVFSALRAVKGCLAGYYYSSLVYEDLSNNGSCFKNYGEITINVTNWTFRK